MADAGVKFYAPSGLCKAHGYRSEQNKFTGWSVWLPHAVPQGLEGDHVSCARLRDAALPSGLELVFDRRYTAVAGILIDFDHFLICPTAEMSSATLQALGDAILHDTCALAGAASAADHGPDDARPHEFFQLESVEGAVGSAAAAEHALRACANDAAQPVARRVDAAVLSAWLGTNDPSMEDLAHEAPWAARLVLWVLRMYPVAQSDPPLLREYHPIALHTIERHLLDDADIHAEDVPSDATALSGVVGCVPHATLLSFLSKHTSTHTTTPHLLAAHLLLTTSIGAAVECPLVSLAPAAAAAAAAATAVAAAAAAAAVASTAVSGVAAAAQSTTEVSSVLPGLEHLNVASTQPPAFLLRAWQQLPEDCRTAVRLVLYHVEDAVVSDFDGDIQSDCLEAIASRWARPATAVHLIPLAYNSVCLAVLIDDNFAALEMGVPAWDELPDVPPMLRLPLRVGGVDTHVFWEPSQAVGALPAVPEWTDLREPDGKPVSAETKPVVLPECSTTEVLRLHAIQCQGNTKGGKRCKNRTKSHYGYCWRHDYQRSVRDVALPLVLSTAEAPVNA